MSWFTDIGDWVGKQFGSSSNWGSDAGDFLTKTLDTKSKDGSTDWGKIIDGGRKLYNVWDVNDARKDSRSNIADILAKADAENATYQQQLQEYNQQQAGAAAAARRATDAARRKAEAKAMKQQKKAYGKLIDMYQPYADAVKSITPNMTKNYNQFLDTTALLNQYLAPSVMKNMQQPMQSAYTQQVPQSMANIPVPQSQAISFPTLEEALKRGS
jgi:hypothetical protein